MTKPHGYLVVLLLFIVGGAIVFLGKIEEEKPDLSSVMEIWGDVLRDADRFGLQLTRVSAEKEMEVGRTLSRAPIFPQVEDTAWTPYVSAVGKELLPYVRRKIIDYKFHVVDAEMINAFALPGGQVYITTGMLGFLQTEAELAAILGHEISHVDLRHCIERLQYELAFRKVGLSEIGLLVDITRSFLAAGYNKYQEIEADAQGVRLSIEAGYDPDAATVVFKRLEKHFGEKQYEKARTPVGEIAGALGETLGSYFRSHPYSAERAQRLAAMVHRNHRRLSGQNFYVGRTNYEQKLSKDQKEFPDNSRRF
jgi:predicted Zn-dependent protease